MHVTDADMQRAVKDGASDGFLRIDARTEDGVRGVGELLGGGGGGAAALWGRACRVVESGLACAVDAALRRLERAGDMPAPCLDDIIASTQNTVRLVQRRVRFCPLR